MKHLRFAGIIFAEIALAVFFTSCQPAEKNETKDHYFPEVGWTISVPTDFSLMDSLEIEATNDKGLKAIENTYDTTISINDTKTLLSIKKGPLNYFGSTVSLFDTEIDGEWAETNEALKEVVFETLTSQMPGTSIDTASSVEKIGGIEFDKFEIKGMLPGGKKLTMLMYSRLYKGYDFGINLVYDDIKVGEKLIKMLATSKFD